MFFQCNSARCTQAQLFTFIKSEFEVLPLGYPVVTNFMASPPSPPPLPESLYSTHRQRILLKRDDRRAELLLSQVTTTHLRRVFQVDPAAVWLQDGSDDTAYFPANDGTFTGLQATQTLFVEGPPARLQTGSAAFVESQTLSSTDNVASSTPPQFRSVVPGLGRPKASTPTTTVRVKIIKAEMNWCGKNNKPSFSPSQQAYVEIQESTATVDYIREEIRKKWGDSYILVTNDGLELEGSASTTGMSFWKAPRRVIYAITRTNLRKKSAGTKKRYLESSDDDDDDLIFETPLTKKRCKSTTIDTHMKKLLKEMDDVKKMVSDTVSLTKECNIPIPLIKLMRDTFKCKICHSIPSRPPLIVSRCCKVILGCATCINSWFSGAEALTKPCPCCRHERGYNETMTLRGLDDFLMQTQDLIKKIEAPRTREDNDQEDAES